MSKLSMAIKKALTSHGLKEIYSFSFFFWPYCLASGVLVPGPGIEPGPSAVKAEALTNGPPGDSLFLPSNPFDLVSKESCM